MTDGPDLLHLKDFLPYRLSVVSNLVSRVIASSYEGDGLKMAEWRVLAVVAEEDGLPQREVVARTRMDKVTVSRATQALRERDFLKSTPNPNDGRSQLLTTTTAGRALYQRIMPQVQALDARIERHVGDDQVRELKALLDNVERAALSVLPL